MATSVCLSGLLCVSDAVTITIEIVKRKRNMRSPINCLPLGIDPNIVDGAGARRERKRRMCVCVFDTDDDEDSDSPIRSSSSESRKICVYVANNCIVYSWSSGRRGSSGCWELWRMSRWNKWWTLTDWIYSSVVQVEHTMDLRFPWIWSIDH